MWKKRILCLMLILCAFALAACQQQDIYPNQPRPDVPERIRDVFDFGVEAYGSDAELPEKK